MYNVMYVAGVLWFLSRPSKYTYVVYVTQGVDRDNVHVILQVAASRVQPKYNENSHNKTITGHMGIIGTLAES